MMAANASSVGGREDRATDGLLPGWSHRLTASLLREVRKCAASCMVAGQRIKAQRTHLPPAGKQRGLFGESWVGLPRPESTGRRRTCPPPAPWETHSPIDRS